MYKCKICDEKFTTPDGIYDHIEKEHEEIIPKDFTTAQYYYFMKTGKSAGSCVVCKKETEWNASTSKYHRFCKNPKCKEKYKDEFKKRMIGKYGKVHLLNDPIQQRKMLANRSISGEYEWSGQNRKKVPFTGSYEEDFLRFLDVFMNFEAEDIMSPSPHTYYYMYEGEEKFYIPDFFINSLKLEVEIKDGGDNPNNHHKIQNVDKKKEKLKDEVLMSQNQFSYIKITNKNYDEFFEILYKMKDAFSKDGDKAKPIYVVNESFMPVTESQTMNEAEKELQAMLDEAQNEDIPENGVEPNTKQENLEPIAELFSKRKKEEEVVRYERKKQIPLVMDYIDFETFEEENKFGKKSNQAEINILGEIIAYEKDLESKLAQTLKRFGEESDMFEKTARQLTRQVVVEMFNIKRLVVKHPNLIKIDRTDDNKGILTFSNDEGETVKVSYPTKEVIKESFQK